MENSYRSAVVMGATSGIGYPMQLDTGKVAVDIVNAVERRKAVVTINGLYRVLVFFWQLIPRWLWVRMRVC